MAITNISIYQDNSVGDSNLIPIHSPVIFLIDVTFNASTPEAIYVDILNSSMVVIDTYRCIPFRDKSATIRQFMFIANDPIKSIMNGFGDTLQLSDILEFVPDITLNLLLHFYDIDDESELIFDDINCTFIHGNSQFGEYPNLFEQYQNDEDTYYAAKDTYVYLYWYNADITNVVSLEPVIVTDEYALDYDDEQFADYDDELLTIITT
jgi:hypothetical protein